MVVVAEPELEEPAGRNRCHGRATSLPSADEPVVPNELEFRDRLLAEPGLPGLLLSVEDEVELLNPVEPLAPLALREITAKSILPEVGLMITSLIVPSEPLPVEPLISAPINLLARTSWLPDRPVALNEPDLPLQGRAVSLGLCPDGVVDWSAAAPGESPLEGLCFVLEPGVAELSDEFCAWTPVIRPAAQKAVRTVKLFFIPCVSFVWF